MANNKNFDNDRPKNGKEFGDVGDDDSGLGNLPPLSDFDSHGGLDSEGDLLPPLGEFESKDSSLLGAGDTRGAQRPPGAPFPSDLSSDVGIPRAARSDVEKPDFGLVSDGFQDLAADSDFSPETPDIGPGPDSTLDTPIFDSAFGGADSAFGLDQSATATQAMESPMFEDFGSDLEFGTGTGVTPVPDFGPDTGFGDVGLEMGAAAPIGGVATQPVVEPSAKVSRKGVSGWWIIIVGLTALLVGMFTSYRYPQYLVQYIPGNPLQQEIQARDAEITRLNARINTLQQLQATPERPADISQERLDELTNEILTRTRELDEIRGQLEATRASLETQRRELEAVERSYGELTQEVIAAREFLDDLKNDTAIVQARQRGLISEVERLTGYVGELEEANAHRIAVKQAFDFNVNRLLVQVKESIPLAPERFNFEKRVQSVEQLRSEAENSLWITPELLKKYTDIYIRENEMAQATDYFFARIPVTDRFGHKSLTWAECLMRGNWGVYYRTLDGKNIGSFENLGTRELPRWTFRENLPEEVKKSIEAFIISTRVPDFEGQVQVIAENELAGKEGSTWQLIYSSL